MGQAVRLSGIGRIDFQKQLAARDIPIHYGIEEWERDRNYVLETTRR